MQNIEKELLDTPFFSYVDLFFAKKISTKKDSFIAAAYLFASSRQGYLSVQLDKDKLYPSCPFFEEEIKKGFLNLKKTKNKFIISFENRLYLQKNFSIETKIVNNLKRLINQKPKDIFDKTLVKTELDELTIEKKLLEKQKKAIELFIKNPITPVFGGPGTGKTYTASFLAKLIDKVAEGEYKLILTAPTGRAAENLSEKINLPCDTKTLHSLLNIEDESYIDADFIIVDEASMIDASIFAKFLSSIKEGTRVMLMGDPYQLPPVESVNIFHFFCNDKFSNISCSLDRVMRTDKKLLHELADFIKGQNEEKVFEILKIMGNDFSNSTWEAKIFEYVDKYFYISPNTSSTLAFSKFSNFRILSPNRKGEFGVDNLNRRIYEYLKKKSSKLIIPIVVTKTDHRLEIYNGTKGVLIEEGEESFLYFKDRKIPKQMINFEYGFCLSVHKAQGSEFDFILLLLQKSNFFGMEMLYTAVTRAKKGIEILADKENISELIKKETKKDIGLLSRCFF